jgi:N-acetyl-alpha-D-glucosaminyl L-malate synthase BshA
MRIGVLCHSSLGGSARVGAELALGMAERGHHVHLFARSAPPHLRPGSPRVHLHPLAGPAPVTARLDADWSPEDLDALAGLVAAVAARERLDLLHFHYAAPFALVAASVRRRLGPAAPALVGTLHGTDVSAYGRDAEAGPPLARALRAADQLTTVSGCYARLATDVFRLPAPPLVIPNFVDLTRFRPRPDRERLEDRGGRFLIVHISNFRPVKDPVAVARIFLRLHRRLPVGLCLVGVGSELPAARAALSEGGAGGHVDYLGYREDVSGPLAGADLLLMASRAESFCLAALEAMACGVPVLASAVGGLTELVEHGRHGFLYPLDDHERAEQLGVELLSDRERYAEMCRQAVCRAGQFGRERVVGLYEELYRGLIGRRGAAESRVGDLPAVDGVGESWRECTS